MKTDNELIAEFMGTPVKDALYDSDWASLMPVIFKIGDLWEPLSPLGNSVESVCSMPICSRIQMAHRAVVDFIKFYNESILKH